MSISRRFISKTEAISEQVRKFRAKMRVVYSASGDEIQTALLDLLCDTLTRYLEAQDAIHADGLTVQGRSGERKRNPALLTERDARIAMTKLMDQLSKGRDKTRDRIAQADQAMEDALVIDGPIRPKFVS